MIPGNLELPLPSPSDKKLETWNRKIFSHNIFSYSLNSLGLPLLLPEQLLDQHKKKHVAATLTIFQSSENS